MMIIIVIRVKHPCPSRTHERIVWTIEGLVEDKPKIEHEYWWQDSAPVVSGYAS